MSILHRIAESQRALVARRRRERPLKDLKAEIDPRLAPRGSFAPRLRRRRDSSMRFICEIKHASPTAGVLREPFDPESIARAYAAAGAAAISVVTEERFFLGTRDTLLQVRRVVDQPVLMKDFVIDAYQIVEARVLGADAVLLITALLDRDQLREFGALAAELGLECLVEVHDEVELERAVEITAEVVGVNNRNLASFQVDLATTERLTRLMPPDRVVVSESGIRTRDDILRLEQAPVDAVLVGEALMRAENPAQMLERLKGA